MLDTASCGSEYGSLAYDWFTARSTVVLCYEQLLSEIYVWFENNAAESVTGKHDRYNTSLNNIDIRVVWGSANPLRKTIR